MLFKEESLKFSWKAICELEKSGSVSETNKLMVSSAKMGETSVHGGSRIEEAEFPEHSCQKRQDLFSSSRKLFRKIQIPDDW